MNYLNDYTNVYQLIIRLFCVSIFSNSIEYIFLIDHFSDNGIFSWKILKFNINKNFKFFDYNNVFSKQGVAFLMSSRLLLCVILFIFPLSIYSVYLIFLIGIISFIFKIRNTIGNDGSDQMIEIVTITLFITFLFPTPQIAQLGLCLICAQSVLSYVGAGIPKLLSVKWRNGTAVSQIMNTQTYGNKYLAVYMQKSSPVIKYAFNWAVILFETLFFLVLVLNAPYFYVFLLLGVLFHLYNVIIMGLNNFFWAFVTTYPAIIYTHIMLGNYMSVHLHF
ncbi:MAG: hypothetical protein JWP45_2195 [Mucilaginibacter sp.]|nr:hypothetical protein [Mucilaginibacter sp.]